MTFLRKGAAVLCAAIMATLLAGCGPDPLPVHPEVEWEGSNTGPYEDDERVHVLRDYLVQAYAADNALNYTSPELADVGAPGVLESRASDVTTSLGSSFGDFRLWEGPPSFSVIEIRENSRHEGQGIYYIFVCQRLSPWWTRDDPGGYEVIEERDGTYKLQEPPGYAETSYQVRQYGDEWKVRRGEGTRAGRTKCDPGQAAVGTYTTPPDLDLLTEATYDMVVGHDGDNPAE